MSRTTQAFRGGVARAGRERSIRAPRPPDGVTGDVVAASAARPSRIARSCAATSGGAPASATSTSWSDRPESTRARSSAALSSGSFKWG